LGAVASLRVRTSLKTQQQQQQQTAPGPAQQLQQLETAQQAAQLQLLAAAVAVLEQLCHGCHANQAAAASEGLIDQLAGLAALALGGSLEAASPHAQLLAGAADALAAAVEFCVPNKLLARESGGVDVLARLLLMAAEVRRVWTWGCRKKHWLKALLDVLFWRWCASAAATDCHIHHRDGCACCCCACMHQTIFITITVRWARCGYHQQWQLRVAPSHILHHQDQFVDVFTRRLLV
jgi:hypothetical protein